MPTILPAFRSIPPIFAVALILACREARPARQEAAAAPALPGTPRLEAVLGTDEENALRYPVWFGELPGKPGVFLAVERGGGDQDGRIYAFEEKDGKWKRKVFLTLPVRSSAASSDERGFLGLAFHPDYPRNRRYFVYYMPKGSEDSTVIDERLADASLTADAGKNPRRILGIAQPYANHNGGTLAFGPKDGYLYIGTGDGGAAGDPRDYGQDRKSLLGKMLRIDVDGASEGRAYGIPESNPFAFEGAGTRPEIWALGLRNPWKWSFDAETGKLWAGDVGQNNREEIDVIEAGSNHGWNFMEGFACFEPPRECPKQGLALPAIDLPRKEARSITGGHVWRGDSSSPWNGAYLFGDWETRNWWALPAGHKQGDPPHKIGRLPDQPSSFGMDSKGNLYVVGYKKGVIYRVVFPTGS